MDDLSRGLKEKYHYKQSTLNLKEQRQIAKAGMVGSLWGLFVTGLFRFKGAKLLHPLLGWTFLGFTIWHYMIYTRRKK